MQGSLLIAGTGSHAGKSIVVAGICRWLAREGVSVAPFKAQNMALNSFVTKEGAEIGRAQASQAAAAMTQPLADMNPILIKPSSDQRAHVLLLGKPIGEFGAKQYQEYAAQLQSTVLEAYDRLKKRFDVVICEGAGSPAEINLRSNDLSNLGLARARNIPAVVVGDIDRGGVLASLYGTVSILNNEDQKHIAAFLINKFRGDVSILKPGLEQLKSLTGRPTLGVLPWVKDLLIDGEDSLSQHYFWEGYRQPRGKDGLEIAIVNLRWMGNFTDFDPLIFEPGVNVRFTRVHSEIELADLVIIPGTRATVEDLELMRQEGLDQVIINRVKRGDPVVGVCGGYQMIGMEIEDSVESTKGNVKGLGLLPVKTHFEKEKTLRWIENWNSPIFNHVKVNGYEIHHGQINRHGGKSLFENDAENEGCYTDTVIGTFLHGAFESDSFRRALLSWVANHRSRDWRPGTDAFADIREQQLDKLADLIEENVDTDQLEQLILGEINSLPTISKRIVTQVV